MNFIRFRTKCISNDSGMTIIEMVVAIYMLVLFLTVSILITELSMRYLGSNDSNSRVSGIPRNAINDQYNLSLFLERYANILSQPAISLSKITLIESSKEGSLPKGCSYTPNLTWQLPVSSTIPSAGNWTPGGSGYAICLRSTPLRESSLSDLIENKLNAKPGIYFLLGLNNEISTTKIPIRKVFCRPSSFCNH
tara:strand:- start:4128 stop:4709 length:582 start_codon:yes stop_codon:yes gene_type:complete